MTAREVDSFGSIREGVGKADVVGRFVVRDVSEGKIGQLTTYTVQVETVEVLAGDAPSDAFTFVTDAAYWGPNLAGTNRDWLRVGGEVLLLLVRRTDTGELRPVNSQAIYLVAGETTYGVWDGAIAHQFDAAPLADLRDAIRNAS